MNGSRSDGALQKGAKNEGGGNSAEDEGISSSEQDDCDEDAVLSKKTTKTSPYKMVYNSHQQQQHEDASTVEEVLGDLDKAINGASCTGSPSVVAAVATGRTASSSASSSGRDSSDGRKRYCRQFSEPDDAVIVPARIVPEPPRRSRSLFVNKNFEVNPFFEDDEEESADSDLGAYDDDDDDDDDDVMKSRADGGPTTFRSVQNQIKRFSALALRGGVDEERPYRAAVKDHAGYRRKSVYDVFGKPTAVNGFRPVVRSVSTRNVSDSGAGNSNNSGGSNNSSRIPVMKFDGRGKSERSVYLPTAACGDGGADLKQPKVQFVARIRGNGNNINGNSNNNAGLYSGYDKEPNSNGLRALRHVNMSVSTGKLTDFPSGLY